MVHRYRKATWDPITDRDRELIRPRGMSIHTAVVDTQDLYGPVRGQGRTYAHFFNPKSERLRQHQDLNRMARADLEGNRWLISVENWDGYPNGAPGYWKHNGDIPPFTQSQLDNLADLFAYLVKNHGVPNRIATPDNVSGLVWHRLGCSGNYGRYNRNDRKSWSSKQTGVRFSNVPGKLCPGDRRIDQLDEIYRRAQLILNPMTKAQAHEALAELVKENNMKNVGIHWKQADGKTVYAILNPVSGFFVKHTTRQGNTYNNPLARAFDTGDWVSVSESHAKVLEAACKEVRG